MTILDIWSEDLPVGCPPKDSVVPSNQIFYLLVSHIPPEESDFFSNWLLFPERSYKDECIAKACSLWSSISRCGDIKKLPPHRKKTIIEIMLPPHSGMLSNSIGSHHSWWRKRDFNPIPFCRELENDLK